MERALRASAEGGLPEKYEGLRWFIYPREAAEMVKRTGGRNERVVGSVLGAIRPVDCDEVESTPKAANVDVEAFKVSRRAASDTFLFREDEGHEGNATREEIEMGYDEGEITDRCVVWVRDNWYGVKEFLSSEAERVVEVVARAESKKKVLRGRENWGREGNVDVAAVARSVVRKQVSGSKESPKYVAKRHPTK